MHPCYHHWLTCVSRGRGGATGGRPVEGQRRLGQGRRTRGNWHYDVQTDRDDYTPERREGGEIHANINYTDSWTQKMIADKPRSSATTNTQYMKVQKAHLQLNLGEAIPVPSQAHLSYTSAKGRATYLHVQCRCLALRTYVPRELSLPTLVAHGHGQ